MWCKAAAIVISPARSKLAAASWRARLRQTHTAPRIESPDNTGTDSLYTSIHSVSMHSIQRANQNTHRTKNAEATQQLRVFSSPVWNKSGWPFPTGTCHATKAGSFRQLDLNNTPPLHTVKKLRSGYYKTSLYILVLDTAFDVHIVHTGLRKFTVRYRK